MRTLTDTPSIEFLRQEAKDVLNVLRETEATATLADAQRAIAEEYGFRTWSDLKAEVDRRRAEVPRPPEGLGEGVAAAFGLGIPSTPLIPIRYEYMGRRWELHTDRGRFVVRPVFDWIDDGQAEVTVDLQERSRVAGVRSPVPVRADDGGLVRRVQDQSWRVEEWMDLGPTPVEPVATDVARRLGAVLAAIHEVAPPTDRPIQGQWVSPADRPTHDQWRTLLDRVRAAGKPWADKLARLSPTIEDLSGVTAEPPQDAIVITNCDIGVEHVRLGAGGELVIMHWDFAGPMVPEWELATTLFHWTQSASNLETASALIAGYSERRGILPSLSLGSFSSVITGWLTWLLHRAWEAAGPEPSEKRQFAERTVREVLDDPLTVAKLSTLVRSFSSHLQ
jgi:Ser/Thr protein kinase RdoA (MazF antagonist)